MKDDLTTDRELLIRLDERINQIQKDVSFLKTTAIPSNEHVQLMVSTAKHEERLDDLEHFKTKIVTYIGLAAAIGGIVSGILVDYIKQQLNI